MTAPVAVVTGAGRRLGLETCRALLDRGYRVFALYRTDSDGIRTLARQGAVTIAADLADPAQVNRTITDILEQTDQLQLLVNNASEFTADEPDAEQLALQAARLYQVNSIAP